MLGMVGVRFIVLQDSLYTLFMYLACLGILFFPVYAAFEHSFFPLLSAFAYLATQFRLGADSVSGLFSLHISGTGLASV